MQIDKFYSRLKNEFDGYSKDIPIPVPIEREAMDDLMEALVDAEFTTEECAARLGVHPITGVSFHREPFAPDLVTTLIDLFIFQQSVSLSLLENIFAPDQIKDLTRMNLIQVFNNTVSSEVCFFPCYGKYFATDHRQHNDFINQVMPLFGESYILGGIVDRKPLARTLDLCTGSGVHAILAAHHSEEVIGVDINPRAIGFANFNAALAGVDNVKFELGDLYAKVSGQFDLILANPPYNPDDGTEAGENFWSGGKSGTEILSRIIEGFSTYLADGGVSNIISLYPNEPGTLLKDYVELWLGKEYSRYDILENTVPYEDEVNYYVRDAPEINIDAHTFGLLNLRKNNPDHIGEWEIPNMPAVFDEIGTPIYTCKFPVLEKV